MSDPVSEARLLSREGPLTYELYDFKIRLVPDLWIWVRADLGPLMPLAPTDEVTLGEPIEEALCSLSD